MSVTRWPRRAGVWGAAGTAALAGVTVLRAPSSAAAFTQVATLLGTVLVVVAAALLLLSGRVAGHASEAMIGVGLSVVAAGLPLTELSQAVLTDSTASKVSRLLGMLVLLIAGVPLLRALRMPPVDTAARPLRLLVALLAGLVAVGAALIAAAAQGWVVVQPSSVAVIVAATAIGWWSLAGALVAGRSTVARSKARGLAAGFATLALAQLLPAMARGPAEVAFSGIAVVVGAAILVAVGAASLRQALVVQSGRATSLRNQLHDSQLLEHSRRELLHDARSALAGIRSARSTLERYESLLEPASRVELESAMGAELARLGRLLDRDRTHVAGERPYDIGDALEPLAVAFRERGLRLTVQGAQATAYGDPDVLVEIVGNLLDNALTHAPGAHVTVLVDELSSGIRVSVIDTGPGIAPALRDSIFEPGVRSPSSVRPGEGLGLGAARRLACSEGGGLELIDTSEGAWFVIRLRKATEPVTRTDLAARALDGA